MQQTEIKAILFDFGGVLAEEGFRNGLIALAHEQGLDVESMPGTAMQTVYDSGFVLGRGSAEDFWAMLRARTGLHGEDEALTMRILEGFVIRPWMMTLVQALRAQGFITAILSDQTHWLDRLNDKYHFSDAFDYIFNSYYLGKGKRDPGLFDDVSTALSLPPHALLFVDDDAGNVARAREAGLRAIHYTDQHDLVSDLARLGITTDE
jgi:putative hydrolase of the HAD superfamily